MSPGILAHLAPDDPLWALLPLFAGLFLLFLAMLSGRGDSDLLMYGCFALGVSLVLFSWYQYAQAEDHRDEARAAVAEHLEDQYGYKLTDGQTARLSFGPDGQEALSPFTKDGTIHTVMLRVVDDELKVFEPSGESTWALVEPETN